MNDSGIYEAAVVLSLSVKDFQKMKAAFKVLNDSGIYGDEATKILIAAYCRKKEQHNQWLDSRRRA